MRLTIFEKEQLIEDLLLHLYEVRRDYAYKIYKQLNRTVTYLSTLTLLKNLEKQGLLKSVREGKRTYFELTRKGIERVKRLAIKEVV